MIIMSNAVIEGLRELARVALLAAVPVVISSLSNSEFDYKAVGIAVAIAVLRAIDAWLHERNKDNNDVMRLKGLSPV